MSDNKKTAVFGIYTSRDTVERASDTIVKSGFSPSDISVLLPENLGSKQIGTEKASKAPEGAATGATSGALLGGTLGLLAGIGALAIPGVGPFIAAGPIMAALAGMGVAAVASTVAPVTASVGRAALFCEDEPLLVACAVTPYSRSIFCATMAITSSASSRTMIPAHPRWRCGVAMPITRGNVLWTSCGSGRPACSS